MNTNHMMMKPSRTRIGDTHTHTTTNHRRRRRVVFLWMLFVFVVGCVSLNLTLVMKYLKNNANMNSHRDQAEAKASGGDRDRLPPIRKSNRIQQQQLSSLPKLQPAQKTPLSPISDLQNSPIQVAHVVSLIKCGKQASVTGFLDAAAVLRHSIHLQSVHTPSSGSKYSYKMYAIVHEQCSHHAHVLDRLGYTSLIRPSPVLLDEITDGWYKSHVEGENCCGSAEFIKLYAYELTDHPVTVHWDLDVAILQPMDDLFDAILHNGDTEQGQAARSKLQIQHPERPLPNQIDAFFTRDITSSQPWEIRQGVQGGFLVARPNAQVLDQYKQFIRKGNYTAGRGNDRGWDGLGYGGFQGAMAYQGVVAYYYDQLAPNTAVELDACVWNQVVADVIWRGPSRMEFQGQCREYPRPGVSHQDNTPENGQCYDCRVVPVEKVKSAHYTACSKPWECHVPYPRNPRDKRQQERLNNLTNITTCGLLFKQWFDLRKDYEDLLKDKAGLDPSPRVGGYKTDMFGRYCKAGGKAGYIPMAVPPDDFDSKLLYGV